MIHSFSCKNFYSFREFTEIDFKVNKHAPQNDSYFVSESGDRLSKVEAVVGANASGKTNLLKVLPFLKWLIIDSFNLKHDDPIVIRPFAFGSSADEDTDLSVQFSVGDKLYTYSFVINRQRIVSEELTVRSVVKENKSTKKLFKRTWDSKKDTYTLELKNFDLPSGFEGTLRSNTSIVGTAARLNHEESKSILDFWQKIQTNVVEAGWIGDHLLVSSAHHLLEALDFYSENPLIKERAEELLRRFDLGLDSFGIEKKKTENEINLSAHAKHIIDGKDYKLNLRYESSGTKQLFVILKSVLIALATGSIAVIDELEINLHPSMVRALFSLFVSKETNPLNAQFLFSTHSHSILNDLDKYQIILVEKQKSGSSEAWRLDEMSNVRVEDNYYSKYIAGAYGAVPQL